MSIIVQKFGGTSVADSEKILSAALKDGASKNLTALEKIQLNQAESSQYRLFTRIPSQFRASTTLMKIWTIFVDMGLGWKAFGPGSLDDKFDEAELVGSQA